MSDESSVETLFFAALETGSEAERAEYLDTHCGDNATVRRQVEKLLRVHDKVGDFLARPAVERFAADESDSRHQPEASAGAGVSVLDFLEPATSPDSLGRIGDYEVLGVLGQGGFSTVFRAVDAQLQRAVAIKVLAPQLAATTAARERFLTEARSLARVRHANVAQVYSVGEQKLPYMVMELIPGENLRQWLNRTGRLTGVEVAKLGRQIAEGLAASHHMGLIHRDVKPENILLETNIASQHGEPLVKISDFGLASPSDDVSLSQPEHLLGTPMFMSPEQAMGKTLDHRTDLFSLGSVLYTMCCGHAPFRGQSTFEVLRRVADGVPRPIRDFNPETPDWLCDIITRLHAKHPEDRFSSARELADVLGFHIEHAAAATTAALAAPSPESSVPASERPQATQKIVAPVRTSRGQRRAIAVVACFLLLGGISFSEAAGVTDFHTTVIRLVFPEGTLVVEVEDPGVSIQVDGVGLVITGAGAREIRIKPGRHVVKALKDGKLVKRELVSVTNNGRKVVRVCQEATPPELVNLPEGSAEAVAWERSVAALPADRQVEAVIERLKALNPGFDGSWKNQTWPHYDLFLQGPDLRDISPVRAMPGLKVLFLKGEGVTDISPLRGLVLTQLDLSYTGVTDLSPVQGSQLRILSLVASRSIEDLSPLAGLPLDSLTIAYTKVTDLSPLAGMPLTHLNCDSLAVSDLSPLKGMLLTNLGLQRTRVSDLLPLAGMPLTSLDCDSSLVSDADLVHLADCRKLETLQLRGTKVTAAGIARLSQALPGCSIAWDGSASEPR